jgi:hypothetical protein
MIVVYQVRNVGVSTAIRQGMSSAHAQELEIAHWLEESLDLRQLMGPVGDISDNSDFSAVLKLFTYCGDLRTRPVDRFREE